ncbi:adenylate kinase [Streptomyces sp. NBS 14/10]|uniref:adenylate kinase n=1 Tax=Streptomyces sp. NBS 14/10 TaxID=1945643 RepID=UPI000B7F3608|nr:adenylate kinase [Streptomyces sp. NBS 14/10]KAK1184374.1 adenylate kinase [Streptomyces sp. NBS 14/10]
MRLLIMGPPGAGKGTQAITLARRIRGAHISTGDIFRTHMRQQTSRGKSARHYIDAGAYVPDEVTNAVIKDRLAKDDLRGAFVLDGYPRTVSQAHRLDSMLDQLGAQIDGVIALAVDPAELIGRLLKRADTTHRTDDTEEVIRHRLDLYASKTAPLLQVYRDRGLLHEVDGVGPVEEVTARIDNSLATPNSGREASRLCK